MNQPYAILETWVRMVNERNVDGLMALYDSNAVLIPTFSRDHRDTPEKIRGYFERLALHKELRVEVYRESVHEQMHGESIVILSGLYGWKFILEGELVNFEARFSFVLDLAKKAPIIHHHSSQVPKNV